MAHNYLRHYGLVNKSIMFLKPKSEERVLMSRKGDITLNIRP